MLWDRRNDDELPEELRGKKPEEIAAALKRAKELEDALKAEEEKRKEIETRLNNTNTEFEGVKTKLAEIEARVTQPPPKDDPPPDPPSPWTDPHGFVQDQVKGTHAVAMHAGMMTARMYFSQGLTERDKKIFRKYEKEVDQVVNTFAPEARVMPQSFMSAFLYVKGLHEGDIHKAESEKTDFFAETPSRGVNDPPAPEEKLSPEEEEVCKVMHWDPKTYLERRKLQTLHSSGKGQYAKYALK